MPEDKATEAETGVEDQARLEGVRLAARTLEHHLTNHLTLTVGYAELIAEDPELPERLRDMPARCSKARRRRSTACGGYARPTRYGWSTRVCPAGR